MSKRYFLLLLLTQATFCSEGKSAGVPQKRITQDERVQGARLWNAIRAGNVSDVERLLKSGARTDLNANGALGGDNAKPAGYARALLAHYEREVRRHAKREHILGDDALAIAVQKMEHHEKIRDLLEHAA